MSVPNENRTIIPRKSEWGGSKLLVILRADESRLLRDQEERKLMKEAEMSWSKGERVNTCSGAAFVLVLLLFLPFSRSRGGKGNEKSCVPALSPRESQLLLSCSERRSLSFSLWGS
ncbi:hypothetical protein TNIN_369601 [Trichonephila inaurata madagascariensis]|uniref:Uncharacterized protein n=1 Tax=Trichonephila inaurata madagascariensis TaxID=2747483 RepID=A0A8X7BZR3_9ARAC|nr:hypothetical protein TNIN_369601 [Trichonephila inaurata madagascariensis]